MTPYGLMRGVWLQLGGGIGKTLWAKMHSVWLCDMGNRGMDWLRSYRQDAWGLASNM